MLIQQPFFISARLMPALRIGDAVLSLDPCFDYVEDGRDQATFHLDFPDGSTYCDSSTSSGVGGFRNLVEVFDGFLSFLETSIEACRYEILTGRKSDSADLFPQHIAEWAHENCDQVEEARMGICDEDGNPRLDLIEED